MSLDEYKAARDSSGISNLDIWCRAIGISVDSHKSISAGRMPVSDGVATRIREYFAKLEKRAAELHRELKAEMPKIFAQCDVALDPATFNISIALPGGHTFTAEHRGLDSMNGWGVYEIPCGRGREPLLFLHARVPAWEKQPDKFAWYLWRGPFDARQSYWNPVHSSLLAQCLQAR